MGSDARPMTDQERRAFVAGLENGELHRTLDITTYGAKSGRPRRIETWLYEIDGRRYLTGSPGRRDWYANLLHDPRLIVHITKRAPAEAPARAVPIATAEERRRILTEIVTRLNHRDPGGARDAEAWVSGSPLVEVVFDVDVDVQ